MHKVPLPNRAEGRTDLRQDLPKQRDYARWLALNGEPIALRDCRPGHRRRGSRGPSPSASAEVLSNPEQQRIAAACCSQCGRVSQLLHHNNLIVSEPNESRTCCAPPPSSAKKAA